MEHLQYPGNHSPYCHSGPERSEGKESAFFGSIDTAGKKQIFCYAQNDK
jgi:hypothetical protein